MKTLKTTKLILLLFLTTLSIFVGCSQQDSIQKQDSLKLKNLDIDFGHIDFTTAKIKSNVATLNKYIADEFFDLDIFLDNNIEILEWSIIKTNDSFLIKQNLTIKNLSTTAKDFSSSLATCPSGEKKYKKCTDKECAKTAIKQLADELRVGESITIKRNLLNVTICGTNALVDRALKLHK